MLVKRIDFNYCGVKFDIELKSNVTIINGQSGIGKTLLYRALMESDLIGKTNATVVGINYLTKEPVVQLILNGIKNSLIIVDNADIVLGEEQRKFIANDSNNQYILFAHAVYSFWVDPSNIGNMILDGNTITVKY